MTITEGSVVSFEYTLTDDAGNTIDTNVGGNPLEYTHGSGQIVIGLEKELEGLNKGDSKKVTVSPEEGYGVVEPKAFIDVPKEKVPTEAHNVGNAIQAVGQDGQPIMAVVSEVKEDAITLDFNHPLAGKNLHFDVKIIDVAAA
ncbi:MAG: FKBP-type peptidyl-prolyl cis-trans isomerase [Bdellovibrionales bacterium]|nr:FKBP-type peptidyl-prolyl cis-trans isomerase [Bdellovibrionales bacterium]